MRPEALVLGAGVIGLTAALRLQEAGWRVRVWAAARWPETVSRVAAAIWYPYRAYPARRVDAWAARAFSVFEALAADPATGVRMLPGRVLWRSPSDDPRVESVPSGARPMAPGEVPAPYRFGAVTRVPVVEMPIFLPWLEQRLLARGGVIEPRAARSLDEALAASELVVNCTGLGARELAGDPSVAPIRGQVVRVENPGLDRFTLDAGEHDRETTYVIPRSRDVVLGGTADEGAWSLEADESDALAILARCIALEPRLAGARVLGHAVGLRPGRAEVRVEREERGGGRIIHCYGHGGSGVTVSWGCAEAVLALAGSGPPAEP